MSNCRFNITAPEVLLYHYGINGFKLRFYIISLYYKADSFSKIFINFK